MIAWNALLIALRQIRRNGSRTILTTLGILIGVAAVIAMVTLGQGTTASINADLEAFGDDVLFVQVGAEGGGPSAVAPFFTLDDATAIERTVRGVGSVAPGAYTQAVVINGDASRTTGITGTTNAYFEIMGWRFASGRAFTEPELRAGTAVCVLGQTVVEELFGAQDPIGRTVRVGSTSLRVVGTLESKGQSTFGEDQDDVLVVPIGALHRRLAGNRQVHVMMLTASSEELTPRVKGDVETLMRQRRRIRPGEQDNFNVLDMAEVAETVGSIMQAVTALLAAIAGVSLLVGGIGIMNIMLVSVTERTREIGIRLAVGAQARDVLLQFLIESIVLSALGGVAGIALGLAGSAAAADELGLPFVIDPAVIALAIAFSSGVGIAFGYFPARKAARLNPIDALRHE